MVPHAGYSHPTLSTPVGWSVVPWLRGATAEAWPARPSVTQFGFGVAAPRPQTQPRVAPLAMVAAQ